MAHFELTGATRRNNMRNVGLMGYAAARSPNAAGTNHDILPPCTNCQQRGSNTTMCHSISGVKMGFHILRGGDDICIIHNVFPWKKSKSQYSATVLWTAYHHLLLVKGHYIINCTASYKNCWFFFQGKRRITVTSNKKESLLQFWARHPLDLTKDFHVLHSDEAYKKMSRACTYNLQQKLVLHQSSTK
jgi:hypothetical protein